METEEIGTEVAQGTGEGRVGRGGLAQGRVLFCAMRREANP